MAKRKFQVYLAGPISGCNDIQVHRWRNEVKQKYEKNLEFIDPAERKKESSYEIVKHNIQSIEEADGILVNMWRESIGTAIGIVHAYRAGRPVVVANPNHLGDSILGFYALAVEGTPLKAAKALLSILRADANWQVMKSGDRENEPFSREKLVNALRAACHSTRRNTILVPALVLPRVLDDLEKTDRKLHKQLTATDINKAVLDSLDKLEANPDYQSEVKGIAARWRRQGEKGPSLQASRRTSRTPTGSKFQVEIASGKSHATIWGKAVKTLSDIPSPARQVFQTIMKVDGITRIGLGPFGHKEERSSIGAVVQASNQEFVIDGKLFDQGPKGTMQTFQVRVQNAERRNTILGEIIDGLEARGYWVE